MAPHLHRSLVTPPREVNRARPAAPVNRHILGRIPSNHNVPRHTPYFSRTTSPLYLASHLDLSATVRSVPRHFRRVRARLGTGTLDPPWQAHPNKPPCLTRRMPAGLYKTMRDRRPQSTLNLPPKLAMPSGLIVETGPWWMVSINFGWVVTLLENRTGVLLLRRGENLVIPVSNTR